MATIRGVGVVWGFGSDFAVTGTGIGTFLPTDLDFEVEAQRVEIPDYKGDDVANIWFNEKNRIRLNVRPKGATLDAAKAANIVPSPGTPAVVIETDDSQIEGAEETRYVVVRASKRKATNDAVSIVMELERAVANDITADVAAS
jgi:hypothetical protein